MPRKISEHKNSSKFRKAHRIEPYNVDKLINEKIGKKKETETIKKFLTELIKNKVIPIELLDIAPDKPQNIGKTKFDQIYDAAKKVAFPGYANNTIGYLLGKDIETKIWRAVFPQKFKISNVLIRADDFQHAFALACDYACRYFLRAHKKFPNDLQIRVMFVSERALRRYLKVKHANRVNKRKKLNLEGRIFTHREITGARLAALGDPDQPEFSIFKYMEKQDLRQLGKIGKERMSKIEYESVRAKIK